jgi:rhamnosyltransferase
MPLVSIILLTKNAEQYLDEVLEGIFQQQCDFSFEVIQIDSGSKDNSLQIAKNYPVRIVSIPPETYNHGDTRNLGMRESERDSQFSVYLTQDATPFNEHWLKNLIQPLLDDSEAAGVFSRHVPRKGSSVSPVRQLVQLTQTGSQKRIEKQMPPSQEEYEENRIFYVWFSNTSSSIRKEIWKKFPFKKVDFAEDAVWADEVIQAGYKIIFEPSSVVIHSHDYPLIEQFRQNVDHQRAMYRLFQPKYLRNGRTWLKQYAGIPLQSWRDYQFTIDSPYFREVGFRRKFRDVVRSPFWYFATISGGLVGAYFDKFPKSLTRIVSRQERIKLS